MPICSRKPIEIIHSKLTMARPGVAPRLILQRKRVFNAIHETVTTIRKNNIKNLIIVDKSARPIYLGILEYYKLKYPGEKAPKMYFLNPEIFKSGDISSELVAKFASRYKLLIKEKDNPLMVIDNCEHSGKTMNVIKKLLLLCKFKNVNSKILFKPEEEGIAACWVLGKRHQNIVTDGELISNRNYHHYEIADARQIRKEIKELVKENI